MSRLTPSRAAYRIALLLARPWVHVRIRLRARREPEYAERVAERFGRVPETIPRGVVWFHTVSAGETIAAAPLIEALAGEFPRVPFLVTTMTPTGSAQVRARLGGRVHHCYAPYDFPDAVTRFFDAVEPRLLVLMETELWPTILATSSERRVPALLVNARLSERSAAGYRRIGALTREMLQALDHIACQYPEHAERFLALGASRDRVSVCGSVKFDVDVSQERRARVAGLARRWGLEARFVWIAGSTHPGEESIVLQAHRSLLSRCPDAVLILVPRHPARATEVAATVEATGFAYVRTSESVDTGWVGGPRFDVILGDRMGELFDLYGLARVAFVGGSLVEAGGHNPIEPAAWGQRLLMGPHRFNFADVAQAFEEAGCLHLVESAAQLAGRLVDAREDASAAALEAAAATRTVVRQRGATERLAALLRARIAEVS